MVKPRRVVVVVMSSLVLGGSLHAGDSPTIHDIRPRGARPDAAVTLVITGTHLTTTAGAELVTGSGSDDATTNGAIVGEVVRVAPFAGKVDIKVGGLPAGLSAKPLTVDAGTTLFRVDLTASDDLPAGDYKVRLEATTPLEVAKKKTVVHSIAPVLVKLKVSRERVRIEARIP